MTSQVFFLRLKASGIPLADIRILFDDGLNLSFDRIGIDPDQFAISNEDAESVIEKLTSGYPVNYLVGFVRIRSLKLFLNEWILIPRTETIEFLYDTIKNQYDFNGKKVLDLCTGSGVIGLSVKALFSESLVTLSDNYDEVLSIAKKNARTNSLDVKIQKSDYLDDIDESFDVILCNPPYIEEGSSDVDAPFEPKTALYSGSDGLDSYRSIFSQLDSHLNEGGIAFFEIESSNFQRVESLIESMLPSFRFEAIKDMENKIRYLKLSRA